MFRPLIAALVISLAGWCTLSALAQAQAPATKTSAQAEKTPVADEKTSDAKPAVDEKSSDATAAEEKAPDADSTEAEAAADSNKKGFWSTLLSSGAMGYMIDGGFFMWPILIMAVIVGGATIERLRSLKMAGGDTTALRERVLELLKADRPEEALEICSREHGPVPAVLTAGLRKYVVLRRLNYDPTRIEEQVVKAMEDYGVHIVAALERHLPILATIASVAPMVGSVGTVTGMIILFKDIVAEFGQRNIILAAAAGIQVKLLVTVWGLMVGIPAYVAFNYFTTVINRYILNVEETASELIGAVTLQNALRNTPPLSEPGLEPADVVANA